MRILILSVGTRGDVEPVCAFVQELLNDDNDGVPQGKERPKHSIDLAVQRNLMHLARHLLTTQEHGGNSYNHRRLRLHELPFTNNDFYRVVAAKGNNDSEAASTPAGSNRPSLRDHPDPRMKSVGKVADIVSHLVLPCYDQVEAVVLKEDINLIITASAMTRTLAFMLARLHKIRVVVLNLQPTVPNSVFPNYRVSTADFARAIVKGSGQICDGGCQEYEESYWKLEKAMEDFYLRPSLERLAMEKTIKDVASSSSMEGSGSYYYSWSDLKRILSGHDPNFFLVNAYSNHLIPSLGEYSKSWPHVRNIYDVGPLADAYLPPGTPSEALIRFLQKNDGDALSHHHVRSGSSPIICIGFGSMIFPSPKILWRALQILNVRAVLVGSCLGWNRDVADDVADDSGTKKQHYTGGAIPSSDCQSSSSLSTFLEANVYCVGSIPYAYLLPHCTAMLCHGGAGVVHACLRAGIPCVVAPVLGDQFAWGELLQARGLGLKIERSLSNVTTQDIVDALCTVMHSPDPDVVDHKIMNNNRDFVPSQNTSIRERCRVLGEIIRQEPQTGVQKLTSLIDAINDAVNGETNSIKKPMFSTLHQRIK